MSIRLAATAGLVVAMVLVMTACGRHEPRPLSPADVQAAFHAVFPGKAAETVNDTELTFVGKKLVPVSANVYALISEGSSADACHPCTGKLRISYLTRNGDAFAPLSPPKQTDIDGNGFGAPPDWKVDTDGGTPAIFVTTGYTAQGCTQFTTRVYHLTPDGLAENKNARKNETDGC